MVLLDALKLMLTQPMYLLIFMATVPGVIYLIFLFSAAICLAVAVRKESGALLKTVYCLQILPCACALWHYAVSDEIIVLTSIFAFWLFVMMLAITLVVHIRNRHLFVKAPAAEREWPMNGIDA